MMDIVYGPDNYRRTTTLTHNHEVVKSKLFAGGNFEVETDAGGRKRYLHYISGGDGLCAIYVKSDENNKGTMYYVQKDHLGSMYAVTGENGEIVNYNDQQQVYSFGPCLPAGVHTEAGEEKETPSPGHSRTSPTNTSLTAASQVTNIWTSRE